jgi:hypothetical protein
MYAFTLPDLMNIGSALVSLSPFGESGSWPLTRIQTMFPSLYEKTCAVPMKGKHTARCPQLKYIHAVTNRNDAAEVMHMRLSFITPSIAENQGAHCVATELHRQSRQPSIPFRCDHGIIG